MFERKPDGSKPSSLDFFKLFGEMNAPALSSVPSIPSVSQAIAQIPSCPRNSCRSASVNSVLGPPRPEPCTVTLVSPPDSITARQRQMCIRDRICIAFSACNLPASRDSPSRLSPSMSGVIPASLTAWAAARSDCFGVAIK